MAIDLAKSRMDDEDYKTRYRENGSGPADAGSNECKVGTEDLARKGATTT